MYQVIEPTVATNPFFSVTWESTLKCNLDCSYCSSHDNSIPHPSLGDCIKTVDFIYDYVDLYMSVKNSNHNHVSLNIFGGESLFHPNIVEILEYADTAYNQKQYSWTLGINTVTNAIVKPKVWDKLIKYFSYFTVSYHSECTEEDQELFKSNILTLKQHNKSYKVSVLMHPHRWNNCIKIIDWCKDNNINYLVRQLDDNTIEEKFAYAPEQADWFYNYAGFKPIKLFKKGELVNLNNQGRSCCGGQEFNINQDYSCTHTYIPNNTFTDWHCSVNYFFVFIKQATKEVFNNKDCRMSYDKTVGPIGSLDDTDKIIHDLKHRLANGTSSIVCKKPRCWCGLCTPKAKDIATYNDVMKKYVKEQI